jgi:hypothetical protein
MNGNDTTEPKDLEFEVSHRVYSHEPKYDVRRRISMGSETVARCWDLRWAKKIMHLLEKDACSNHHRGVRVDP